MIFYYLNFIYFNVFKFLKNNKLTRSIRSKDKDPKSQEKEANLDKLVVFDEKQEEKEDEFIVKMLIEPMTEGDGNNENGNNGRFKTKTLTQLMKKKENNKPKSTNKPDEIEIDDNEADDPDDEVNNSISSQELNDVTRILPAGTRKNKLVYLCALEDGTKQKVSVLKLMYQIKPKYVILYDTVLWFVRQLEVFKTIHHDIDMRVYFMIYSNSCEEQRYLTSVRCEKESFEILIREKAVRTYLKIFFYFSKCILIF